MLSSNWEFSGEFLVADMGFVESGEMSVARILVLLNIREGLKEFLNLTDLGRTRVQILDYEGVPFHCRRCHEYGHIVKDCKSTMKEHRNNRSTSDFRANGGLWILWEQSLHRWGRPQGVLLHVNQ
jgi:hypothetical protein